MIILFETARRYLSGKKSDIGEPDLLLEHLKMYDHLEGIDPSELETEKTRTSIFGQLSGTEAYFARSEDSYTRDAVEVLRKNYPGAECVYSKKVSYQDMNMGYIAVLQTSDGESFGINVAPVDESIRIKSHRMR